MTVVYSRRALSGLESIVDYLRTAFSAREVARFADQIERFERTVLAFPYAFAASPEDPEVHHAVIHPRCIIAYTVDADAILVVDAWDTRQDR